MVILKNLDLKYGAIKFILEIPNQPAKSEVTENVTINHQAVEGRAAHFEASFMINGLFENQGMDFTNVFHMNYIVPEPDIDSQYLTIETQAVEQLAPMLRLLADEVDKQVSRTNSDREKRAKAVE